MINTMTTICYYLESIVAAGLYRARWTLFGRFKHRTKELNSLCRKTTEPSTMAVLPYVHRGF